MPRKELSELFVPGSSPYVSMYTAGRTGYSIEEVVSYCNMVGIPLRQKDVANWESGHFVCQMDSQTKWLNPGGKGNIISSGPAMVAQGGRIVEDMELSELPTMPDGWKGTEKRFFPCTAENKPMMQWGWKPNFVPQLMCLTDAKVLSPCGWVGQNMLYQPFIVVDIDGAGHGERDQDVIDFGRLFQDDTLVMEDPAKEGSFHLYFKTNRLVPVRHYPHAKIDLMGNAVNAAVYLKNKKGNGVEPMTLTDEVWRLIMNYQKIRKENMLCH